MSAVFSKVAPLLAICWIQQNYAATGYRSDQVGQGTDTGALISSEAPYGGWAEAVYCDPGFFANAFVLGVEGVQGGGDDTSANWFHLICVNNTGQNETVIASNDAPYAATSATAACPSGAWLTGFKTKVESPQGGNGDDTALNSVKGLCSDDSQIEPSNGGPYGDWALDFVSCGARQSVCGFLQRAEGAQGGGDDTGLNAVELFCCSNRRSFNQPRGYWERVIGGNGDLTYTTTKGVTDHTQDELTTSFGASVTAAVSAGMEFEGIGVTTKLSTTVSTSIAESTLTAVTTTVQTSVEFTCPTGSQAMYQWITALNENHMTEAFDFEIRALDFWCVSNNALIPQCPFGYCADDNCQVCNEPLGDLSLVLVEEVNTTATMYDTTTSVPETTMPYYTTMDVGDDVNRLSLSICGAFIVTALVFSNAS